MAYDDLLIRASGLAQAEEGHVQVDARFVESREGWREGHGLARCPALCEGLHCPIVLLLGRILGREEAAKSFIIDHARLGGLARLHRSLTPLLAPAACGARGVDSALSG